MNRYLYYHFLIICFTNLILLIPFYLVEERYHGAVMGILLNPVIAAILLYMFTNGISRFPGKGMPEIMRMFYPNWLVQTVLVYKIILSGLGAIFVISVYVSVITRFINPDTSQYLIMIVFLIACIYGATRSNISVNFIMEIFVILNTPLVVFIFYKVLTNPLLNWDAIRIVANHTLHPPSILALASSAFVFTGFTNLFIFNRLFPANFKFKFRWVLVLLGFFILLLCFFLPIGINGTTSIAHFLYIWTATSDAIRMEYGFIERTLFVFILVLLGNGFAYIVVGLHMTMQYIWALSPKYDTNPETIMPKKYNLFIAMCMISVCILLRFLLHDMHYIKFGGYFLIIRFFSEAMETVWLYLLSKKKVRKFEKHYAS